MALLSIKIFFFFLEKCLIKFLSDFLTTINLQNFLVNSPYGTFHMEQKCSDDMFGK